MKTIFITFIFWSSFLIQSDYSKSYYPNGKMKEEGWIIDNMKNKYWFFYYENGSKKQEGHFKNNSKTDWWIFYDKEENVLKKCEFRNNKLEGFSINYRNGEICSAEKYRQGKRIKYWNSLAEFKKDNSDLF